MRVHGERAAGRGEHRQQHDRRAHPPHHRQCDDEQRSEHQPRHRDRQLPATEARDVRLLARLPEPQRDRAVAAEEPAEQFLHPAP